MTNSGGATNGGGAKNKVWLVTGATSGFGRQLALAVAGRGDAVIATGRRKDALAELAALSAHIIPVVSDITTADGRAAIREAVNAAGGLDVLVNNAGYGLFGAVEQVGDAAAREVFETHVFGPLALLRDTLPVLRERRGHVITLSSELAVYAWPSSGLYSASKAAADLLSEALAIELAPAGVRVTAIQPGTYATEFGPQSLARAVAPDDVYAPTVGAFFAAFQAKPAAEFGDPREVVDAILAVADDENPPVRVAVGEEARTTIRDALSRRLDEVSR
ncbi:SDR family NAD(P)-dependent oxidoreductase [Actinoplanes sp. LDG1-06]|uniref:SDR family NAD(P)-dependent oxidoreductase n=2 Tax=Paractinoplanes ovalisporus TaxID=2810368 RepID=A0ABS2AHB2_9ACTN|nr:SDR family NAD(P)-dependent oxidoreductase [Actinoplanes ovalisporus]